MHPAEGSWSSNAGNSLTSLNAFLKKKVPSIQVQLLIDELLMENSAFRGFLMFYKCVHVPKKLGQCDLCLALHGREFLGIIIIRNGQGRPIFAPAKVNCQQLLSCAWRGNTAIEIPACSLTTSSSLFLGLPLFLVPLT